MHALLWHVPFIIISKLQYIILTANNCCFNIIIWDWPSGSESRSPSSRRALALTTKYKIETLYTDNVADAVCLSMTFILFSLRYTTVCHQGRRWKFLPMGSKVRGSGDGSLPVGSRGEAPVGGRGGRTQKPKHFLKIGINFLSKNNSKIAFNKYASYPDWRISSHADRCHWPVCHTWFATVRPVCHTWQGFIYIATS